jgi:hypothetical protein
VAAVPLIWRGSERWRLREGGNGLRTWRGPVRRVPAETRKQGRPPRVGCFVCVGICALEEAPPREGEAAGSQTQVKVRVGLASSTVELRGLEGASTLRERSGRGSRDVGEGLDVSDP